MGMRETSGTSTYELTYLNENNSRVTEIFKADTDKKAIKQAEKLLSGKKYTEPNLTQAAFGLGGQHVRESEGK